jgi:sulfonate transport system permease protein
MHATILDALQPSPGLGLSPWPSATANQSTPPAQPAPPTATGVTTPPAQTAQTAQDRAARRRWPAWPAAALWRTRLQQAGLALLLPLAVLLWWQLAASRHWMPEQILPPPALVWQSLLELWHSGELSSHLGFSARRVLWSLAIGCSSGLLLGLALGLSRRVQAYVLPGFTVLAQFPVLGWVPLLIIFCGIDEALKITAISIAVIVPVAINTHQGIVNIPRAWLEVAQVYRFSALQVIWRVVLPASTPSLFNGLRQAVMQAWQTLVFVELLASSEGIGYLMVWGRQLGQLDLVMLGMLLIGAIGVGLDLILRQLETRLQRWRVSAFPT